MMAIKEKPEPREKPWSYPEPDSLRDSGLKRRELIDLADTPRPAKTQRQQDEEAALHALKADRSPITADDRRIPPMRLHVRGDVAEDGTPEMVEAMLRYLNDEGPRTLRERQWFVVLEELQRTKRTMWALLEEHFFFKRSYREIATQMGCRHSTVQDIIDRGLLYLHTRLVELFGTQA